MSINQSKMNSRGPLIAVIKIEIYDDQVDRIFLHQNDDDYKLAQQFQQKHNLNPMLVNHIYQKIKTSRDSLEKQFTAKSSQPINTIRTNHIFNQSNLSVTPYNNNQDTYRNSNESFLTPFERISKLLPNKQVSQKPKNENDFLKKMSYRQQQDEKSLFPEQRKDFNQNMQNSKDPQSTFETMNKNKAHQQLYQRFLRQKKEQGKQGKQLSVEEKNRVFEREKANVISIYETNQKSRGNKTHSIEGIQVKNNNSIDHRKNYTESHYSFNENKPEKVKILRKNEIDSMKSSKKSLSKTQKSKLAHQVTNRLYNQNEIKKNYLNKIKERAQKEKQQKQDKELTYRPQINQVSQLLAAQRYKNVPVQQYLIEKAKQTEAKKELGRALKAQKQLQNCSFKPQINVVSKLLVKNQSRGSLLKNSQNKSLEKCSRKHTQSQVAFRPSLNKMSEKIVSSKGQGNFEQRLKGYLEQKNSRLSQLNKQRKITQKLDEQGNELFKPRINNLNLTRSPKGAQIHDYLYELSKIDKSVPVQSQKPTINQNSQMIIQQMYSKRIAWLFCELDSDQDGFISPKRICIDTISQDLLQVIIPVLFQMEEMDIELNLLDFKNAIKNLHPSLNAHQKSILYNYSNKTLDSSHKV